MGYASISLDTLKDVFRVRMELNGQEVHCGTVEQLRMTRENGAVRFHVVSKGMTAMLLQNQLAPKLYTGMFIGLPMALQFSITAIGSIILQTSVNTLGSVAVTSVTAAQKICAIVMGPLESLGITMATYCGQNLGARKFYRIRDGIRVSLIVSMCYCIFSILFLCYLGKYTAYLFLDASQTEIIRLAVRYMRINAVFYPVLGILFILRNSLQGMGYSLMPMMAGVSELAARSLVCFLLVPVYGYDAAILASPVAWIFADILLITVYLLDMRKLKQQLIVVNPA